ncbi:hypothetical protein [Thiolinea disciformis]|nr:hypothetical protein [Thiolinea disciformis]
MALRLIKKDAALSAKEKREQVLYLAQIKLLRETRANFYVD